MSNIVMPPDTADVARAILTEAMLGAHRLSSEGYPIVEPGYAVRCSTCNERVVARPRTTGVLRIEYVLPVDSEGRCTSCVLTLCLSCDGREGGCQKCDYTGKAIA